MLEKADCKSRVFLQVPENAQDKQLVGAARGIMKASSQRFDLTYLSCKRDISTLLALSAVQVPHSHLLTTNKIHLAGQIRSVPVVSLVLARL